MEKLFVPYAIALALKEVGYNEEPIGYWETLKNAWNNYAAWANVDIVEEYRDHRLIITRNEFGSYASNLTKAPTYDQVIDWFIDKYGIVLEYKSNVNKLWIASVNVYKPKVYACSVLMFHFSSKQEALNDIILKAVEIVKNTTWICDGGGYAHEVCIHKGKRVPKCDGGCMFPDL